MDPPATGQVAIGNYIAQADHGGVATVSVYEVAAPAPPDEAAVARATDLLARMPADSPPGPSALPALSRMPLAPNPLFTGRARELSWLAARLGATTTPVPAVAVSGLGGVGKSQVASEYAHRFGRYYAGGVHWVGLADPATVDNEIAACGGAQGMQLRPDFARLPIGDQVGLVRAAWQSPLPRLLIFDNCEDESVFARCRPLSGGCRIILTSRRPVWPTAFGIEVRELEVLRPDDGTALIGRYREAETPDDAAALADIAGELGQLPLALHLAGSFLSRYRQVVTPAKYLAQLRGTPIMDHRSLTSAGISPTDHIQSIAVTFAVSVDKLAETDAGDALARQWLTGASYLAPGEAVPRALVRALFPATSSTPAGDEFDQEDALLRLADLGLVQLGSDGMPRLHRLVAAFVQDRLGDDKAEHHVEDALYHLLSPTSTSDSSATRAAYETHLRVVADRALRRGDLPAASLGNLMGNYLTKRGDAEAAAWYLSRTLHIKEHIFGTGAPETARDLNDLGHAYLHSADRARGRPYLERARVLWDPETEAANLAATLDNLGQMHWRLGRLDLAEPLFHQALAIRERTLGENAYGTSVTVQNLAQLAQDRGDTGTAIELLRRDVRIREAIGGESDPRATAQAHELLATALDQQGDSVEATGHYARMAELYRDDLGPGHPHTVWAAVQAANYAVEHGDSSAAATLVELSAALCESLVQGQMYTSVDANYQNNLGFALWLNGYYAEARVLYDLAAARGDANLQPVVLNNLGTTDERLGHYGAAIERFDEALALLDEQPSLRARFLNNLGVSLTRSGRTAEARARLTEALHLRERLEGTDGPDYAVTLRNLGVVDQYDGHLDQALTLLEQGRDILARSPGSHEYARTMHLLGELHAARGDDKAALAALRIALDVRRSLRGPQHPDTGVTLRAMAAVLRRIGETAEACEALTSALPIFRTRMGPDHPWTVQVSDELSRCP